MVAAIENRVDGPCNIVGPGAATPWQATRLGGRVPFPVLPEPVGRASRPRPRSRAPPSRRTSSSCSGAVAPATAVAPSRSWSATTSTSTQDVLARAVRMGRRRLDRDESRGGRVSAARASTRIESLDADRVGRPESPWRALERRFTGRYPIDRVRPRSAARPTWCSPLFTLAVRVDVEGGENVPATGPAVVVANRGFGFVEPAALGDRGAARDRAGGCASSARRRCRSSAASARRSRRDQRERRGRVAPRCAPAISSRSR